MRTFCLISLFVLISITIMPPKCGAAINEKLLNEAKLETAWQSAISLNANEKVERVTILGNYIYILTDSNYLFCLDRSDGKLTFGLPIAEANLPVSEPVDANENIIYMVASNELVGIDLRTGDEFCRKKIEFQVTERPAISSSYFYFAGADNILHVVNQNLLHAFKATADNKSAITSVISDDNVIFFATKGGNVIGMDANHPKKKWQYNTVGPVETPLVKDSNAIYISGKDTNLYKVSADKGKLVWMFRSGSFLTTPARVTDTTVYQYARNKGLYAIDANNGTKTWLLPGGEDLLAQNGKIAYVFDKNNLCVVMDNVQAKKIYTINFADVTSYAANIYDSKIYVMEGKNIFCIQPVKK